MTRYTPHLQLGVILGLLALGFWFSGDFQRIAAGVALFLLGMIMLEDGFRALGGATLERLLARATGSLPRAMGFGIVATTITQSSSLVSVISISFLSAGLISLPAGIGIIFGANLGTTTGAWLMAGPGVRVDIAGYALPMLVFGTVLVFQSGPALKGAGRALLGVGLIFLGIAFIKEGFDAASARFDLTQLALTGLVGLGVYTLIGAVATVVMQSSHASMLLVITALASGQITYENALAVAIGANIGTTVTAMIGAASANYQGRRLALAHLVFNIVTAGAALALIVPLRISVDWIGDLMGIGAQDFALRLALFHTIFNLLGIALMVPLIPRLVAWLEARIARPAETVSRPRYITAELGDFPAPVLSALRKELRHLQQNATALICAGLNLRLEDLRASRDLRTTVARAREPIAIDFEARYTDKVKTLHAAILDFAARKTTALPPGAARQVQELRDAANALVRAVKAAKHMRENTDAFTTSDQGVITALYDDLRLALARILVDIESLADTPAETGSVLWLQEARRGLDADLRGVTARIEQLLQQRTLSAGQATSFLNDSGYAVEAMRALLDAAERIYPPDNPAMAELEKLLALDDDDDEPAMAAQGGDASGLEPTGGPRVS